jgi:hypothetical protein
MALTVIVVTSLCDYTELTYRIPERFISLTLSGTTAGGLPWFNIPPVSLAPTSSLQKCRARVRGSGLDLEILSGKAPRPGNVEVTELKLGCRAQFIKDPKNRIPYFVEVSFSAPWLGATAENDAKGRTNREVQIEVRAWTHEPNHTLLTPPQAISKTGCLDTCPEPNRGHLADVGCIDASRATQPSRSNIENDSQSGDPDGRTRSFGFVVEFGVFEEAHARGRVYRVERFRTCREQSVRGTI